MNPITSLPEERSAPPELKARVWRDLAQLAQTPEEKTITPDSHRWSHGRRRAVLVTSVTLVAAIVLLVTLVLPSLLPPGAMPAGPRRATAATALRQAADRTEANALPLAQGEYRYLKVTSMDSATYVIDSNTVFHLLLPHETQWWIGVDGSGTQRSSTGQYEFASPNDKNIYEQAGSPPLPQPHVGSDMKIEATSLQAMKFSDLPTDPEAIIAAIRNGAFYGAERDPLGDIEVFRVISDGLQSPIPTPEQKAGLYRAAALLSRVRLFGPLHDSLGRTGTGVGLISDGQADVLIFDTTTGTFLERSSWPVDSEGNLGKTPTTWTTVVDESIVARDGVEPNPNP